MRAQRRTSAPVAAGQRRRPMSGPTVRFREWIRIPIPGDPFPVHVRVGNAPERPAFIDHEGTQTIAAIRCPNLAPGVHGVVVRLPDGTVIESSITVAPSSI
jgi:hypothetical protein